LSRRWTTRTRPSSPTTTPATLTKCVAATPRDVLMAARLRAVLYGHSGPWCRGQARGVAAVVI
jgi:hypothetical protein